MQDQYQDQYQYQDRCYGCFYGAVIGDALGGPVEFRKRGSFSEVKDMNLVNFNLGLEPGGWTDDTSMMLCLANSLIEHRGKLEPRDVLEKYVQWFRNGYMSSTEYCVDIGKQTIKSLIHFEHHGTLVSIESGDRYAGNGSIMRLAAVPIAFRTHSTSKCIEACIKSSETTHASKPCKDACALLGFILHEFIHGVDKIDLVTRLQDSFQKDVLHPSLHTIYEAEYLHKTEDMIHSSGYVAHTLEAALYCFYKTNSYKTAVLKAVNMGDDSDTVGCVTGQIAGAYYGFLHLKETIPSWLHSLAKKELLDDICVKLFETSL
jgi:ADP-ribosylglycohydrolase